MPTETQETEIQAPERVNLYLPAALRNRLKKAATKRGTSESQTAVKFLERSLDWFEGLTDDEQVAL